MHLIVFGIFWAFNKEQLLWELGGIQISNYNKFGIKVDYVELLSSSAKSKTDILTLREYVNRKQVPIGGHRLFGVPEIGCTGGTFHCVATDESGKARNHWRSPGSVKALRHSSAWGSTTMTYSWGNRDLESWVDLSKPAQPHRTQCPDPQPVCQSGREQETKQGPCCWGTGYAWCWEMLASLFIPTPSLWGLKPCLLCSPLYFC